MTVGVAVESAGAPVAPPPSAVPGEEGEVGYDLGLNPPEEEPLSDKNRSSAQPDAQTPSRAPQVSPTFYGVCPLWEDVLARNGEAPHTLPHHRSTETFLNPSSTKSIRVKPVCDATPYIIQASSM